MVNESGANDRREGLAGIRILMVDDEDVIRDAVRRFFGQRGCLVDTAGEVAEAAAMVAHRSYDLAIIDLRLSPFAASEGIDVLREIRRSNLTTRIIVLSAFVSSEIEHEVRRLGAAVILRKPTPLPELAALALEMIEGA